MQSSSSREWNFVYFVVFWTQINQKSGISIEGTISKVMFFPHLRSFVEVRHRRSYNFIPKIVNSLDSLECKQDRNWNEKWAHWNNVSNNLNHCFKFFLHSRSIFVNYPTIPYGTRSSDDRSKIESCVTKFISS